MAISVVFRPENYTVDMHHQVIRRLQDVGQGNPDGRRHHQALARDGSVEMVVDVWESPEKLQAFAAHLMPILVETGINPPQPEVYEAVLLG